MRVRKRRLTKVQIIKQHMIHLFCFIEKGHASRFCEGIIRLCVEKGRSRTAQELSMCMLTSYNADLFVADQQELITATSQMLAYCYNTLLKTILRALFRRP